MATEQKTPSKLDQIRALGPSEIERRYGGAEVNGVRYSGKRSEARKRLLELGRTGTVDKRVLERLDRKHDAPLQVPRETPKQVTAVKRKPVDKPVDMSTPPVDKSPPSVDNVDKAEARKAYQREWLRQKRMRKVK